MAPCRKGSGIVYSVCSQRYMLIMDTEGATSTLNVIKYTCAFSPMTSANVCEMSVIEDDVKGLYKGISCHLFNSLFYYLHGISSLGRAFFHIPPTPEKR